MKRKCKCYAPETFVELILFTVKATSLKEDVNDVNDVSDVNDVDDLKIP